MSPRSIFRKTGVLLVTAAFFGMMSFAQAQDASATAREKAKPSSARGKKKGVEAAETKTAEKPKEDAVRKIAASWATPRRSPG